MDILRPYLIEIIFLQRDLIEYAVEIPRLKFPIQVSKVSVRFLESLCIEILPKCCDLIKIHTDVVIIFCQVMLIPFPGNLARIRSMIRSNSRSGSLISDSALDHELFCDHPVVGELFKDKFFLLNIQSMDWSGRLNHELVVFKLLIVSQGAHRFSLELIHYLDSLLYQFYVSLG